MCQARDTSVSLLGLSARASRSLNRVQPPPLSTLIWPPILATRCFTIDSPRPVPPYSREVDSSAVDPPEPLHPRVRVLPDVLTGQRLERTESRLRDPSPGTRRQRDEGFDQPLLRRARDGKIGRDGGEGAVVKGRLDENRHFTASEVLAKHDENYMPPEVADALEKSGYDHKGIKQ